MPRVQVKRLVAFVQDGTCFFFDYDFVIFILFSVDNATTVSPSASPDSQAVSRLNLVISP